MMKKAAFVLLSTFLLSSCRETRAESSLRKRKANDSQKVRRSLLLNSHVDQAAVLINQLPFLSLFQNNRDLLANGVVVDPAFTSYPFMAVLGELESNNTGVVTTQQTCAGIAITSDIILTTGMLLTYQRVDTKKLWACRSFHCV